MSTDTEVFHRIVQHEKEEIMTRNTVWRGMRKRTLGLALVALMVAGGGISGSYIPSFAEELNGTEAADQTAVEALSENQSEAFSEAESLQENTTTEVHTEDTTGEDAVSEDVVTEDAIIEETVTEDEPGEDAVTDISEVDTTDALTDMESAIIDAEEEFITEEAMFDFEGPGAEDGYGFQYYRDANGELSLYITYVYDDEYLPNLVIPETIDGIPVKGVIGTEWYKEDLQSIVFPDVEGFVIGEGAFANCVNLKQISFPYVPFTIEDRAFSGCYKEPTFVVGLEYATSIGAHAFDSCNVDPPYGGLDICATTIGEYAFANNKDRMSVYLHESVETVGKGAFQGCTELLDVYVDNPNTSFSRDKNNIIFPANPSLRIIAAFDSPAQGYVQWMQENRLGLTLKDNFHGYLCLSGTVYADTMQKQIPAGIGGSLFITGHTNLVLNTNLNIPDVAIEDRGYVWDRSYHLSPEYEPVLTISGSGSMQAGMLAVGRIGVVMIGGFKSIHLTVLSGNVSFDGIGISSVTVSGGTLKSTAGLGTEKLTVTGGNLTVKTLSTESTEHPAIAVVEPPTIAVYGPFEVKPPASVVTPAGGKVGPVEYEILPGLGKTSCTTVVDTSGNWAKEVVISVPVTGVTLNKTALTLTAGQTQTLTATVSPPGAANQALTWSSSNTGVATVDASGNVKAVAAGTATITAMAQDGSGKSGSCTVTVTAASSGGGSGSGSGSGASTGSATGGSGSGSGTGTGSGSGTGSGTSTGTGNKAVENINSKPDTATGTWKQSDDRWWFEYSKGGYPQSRWEKIKGACTNP